MDFQNRAGGKTGTGGQASWSEMNRDRRERLRQLALETIDLAKDPYFMKNHLGSYECKLCLTLHNNEGSYLAHTQVKTYKTITNRLKWLKIDQMALIALKNSKMVLMSQTIGSRQSIIRHKFLV